MPIVFALGLGLCILFASLAIAISVISSRCMFAIQGTAVEGMFKNAVAATKPSKFIPLFARDGGPSDTRVWLALRGADYLPEAVQRKARVIGWLYESERFIFVGLVVLIVVSAIVR